jgi:cell division protein FtsQ
MARERVSAGRPWSRRWPTIVGAAVALVVTLALVAWFSPVLSLRTVEVQGARTVPERQIIGSLDISEGTPLLQVDTDAAAQRVARIAKIASVRVRRVLPSTIRVTVVERVAAVFFDSPQGTRLLDGSGVQFGIEPPPPGVPRLVSPAPAAANPVTQSALEVLAQMPPELRAQVGEIVAQSVSDISVKLRDGKLVVWGSKDNSARKGEIALAVLTQPGKVYDVSSSVPTVR